MTQSEVERLKEELHKKDLAALVVLIQAATATAERSLASVQELQTKHALLEQRVAQLVESLKLMDGKLSSMNQSKLAMLGTIGAAGITTIANVIIALIRDN